MGSAPGPDVLRSLNQGTPAEEERFKYEVIFGLSESVRELAKGMADLQKTQVGILERLATLEANRFAAAIESIRGDVKLLMEERQQRAGARGAFSMIKEWSPFLGMILAAAIAVVVYGRMAGVVPAAPVAATRVEATIDPVDRKIDGVVGGKP